MHIRDHLARDEADLLESRRKLASASRDAIRARWDLRSRESERSRALAEPPRQRKLFHIEFMRAFCPAVNWFMHESSV
jgi:hypothetical protein